MSEEAVQETETVETSAAATEVNTDTSINASLDEIDDPDTLRKMVSKLRKENAKSRTEKQELRSKADKWAEYEESQRTELEKLQARAEAAEKKALEKSREAILRGHGIDPDDDLAEFITGSEEEMTSKAAKLAERLGKQTANTDGLVPNLFKNPGGTPVKPKTQDEGAMFLEFLADHGKYTS